jgi:hypothetical protein
MLRPATHSALSFVLALVFMLVGCVETPVSGAVESANKQMEAEGSPFRWVARDDTSMAQTLLPLPVGPTNAVPGLADKVLEAITQAEARKGRLAARIEEVRHLPDGREVWVLHSLGKGIAYVVTFEAPSQVDSDVRVAGPTTYVK